MNPDVIQNCQALGEKMREEINGADTLIQQIYARFPKGPVDYLALEKEATWLKNPIIEERKKNRRVYNKSVLDALKESASEENSVDNKDVDNKSVDNQCNKDNTDVDNV